MNAFKCASGAALRRALVVALLSAPLLTACGGGGDETAEAQDPGPGPAPADVVLTFNSSATSVTSGGSATLTWNAQNATACAASGAWSGSKNVQGTASTGALTANSTFTLQCTGAGASASQSVTVSVSSGSPPAPTVTLTASPTSIASGGNSQLTWTSTNATSCTASGAWSGIKSTSGNSSLANLTSTSTYTLTCTGSGGSGSANATVTVTPAQPAPQPTLVFTANPNSVSAGGQSSLTWSTGNATSCTASGGWSGSKATSGNAPVGPLNQTTDFVLACTGAGGNVSQTVTVAVSGGGNAALSGSIDSGYVDRFAGNKIYVFTGNVTPDDIDGDAGDPVTTIPVTQDANACTFSYSAPNLTAGTYTIAFTRQADADQAGANNALTFIGTRQVTVSTGAGTTSNFRPTVLTVGSGKQYATLRAANAAATNGAVIEIDPGTYTDDVTVWRQNNLVLRGIGGTRPHVRGTQVIPFVSSDDQRNGKGIIVVRGSNISIENLEISGARVTDENGAAVRNEGENLTICNSYLHDNENGFLGGAYGTLLIEYTELSNNGSGDVGHTHNIYVDEGDNFIFRHNYSHNVSIGHLVKTRAAENYILYNRLMDEQSGSSSYNIDVPNGGLTYVIGNLIQQGTATDNSSVVSYGAEGLTGGRTHKLYVINNSFVNDLGSGAFIQAAGSTALVRTVNNLFVGGGTQVSGVTASAATNLVTNSPGFTNAATYDYRLNSGSPAKNAGSDPGTGDGYALAPAYQYVHKARREARPVSGQVDIGAYEAP